MVNTLLDFDKTHRTNVSNIVNNLTSLFNIERFGFDLLLYIPLCSCQLSTPSIKSHRD